LNALTEPGLNDEMIGRMLTPARIREARRRALLEQRSVPALLAQALELAHEPLLGALARAFGVRALDAHALATIEPAFDLIGYAEAAKRGCLAAREHGRVVLVLADPFDAALQAWSSEALGCAHELRLALAEDIAAVLTRHEESLRAFDSALPAAGIDAAAAADLDDLSIRSIGEDSSVVVKLVNSTLYDALRSGVSDIHVESHVAGLGIKYRLDGTLAQVGNIEGRELAEQVLSRLKVMSELDIAERRVPQDGRFRVRALGREIDFRVSIMPSIHGEDAVVRVLDKRSLADQVAGLRLDVLGFDATTLQAFRRLTRDPYGLLLVTGPTGSGKTTTLYAAISETNHGRDKIITIEDPVEYQLQGVLQIPVNEKKGLTFARGLRSILRHDPDRIMVGEIRDPDTAQIAIQAALTGHLVLSTVHANNVFDVIGRFTHMEVDPYSFVSALRGVLAQRLVRLNCTHCSEPAVLDPVRLAEAQIDAERVAGRALRAGVGCGKCRGTGFKGRRAVGELLLLDDELRELIVARAPVRRIKEAARRNGTRLLRDAAIELWLDGQTTLEEINRVTLAS
jgi:general secretion pathway protein E